VSAIRFSLRPSYRRFWTARCEAERQRLLVAALRGLTDDELSDDLMVSHSAVKNAWRSIYARGKQKRQRLLAYLRERPEELRPFARKLIAEHRRVAASRRRQASGETLR